MNPQTNLKNKVEGILFASRVPLTPETISKVLVEMQTAAQNVVLEQEEDQEEQEIQDQEIQIQAAEQEPTPEPEKYTVAEIRQALSELTQDYENRGIHLVEVASGYRFQVATVVAPYVAKSLEEKPARYSRALLETLALIAYRQPITRGEIEDIRGVVVSTHIIKTLDEHEWIRVVGYKSVPGKPALYATTKFFLDHFGLKSLDELPPLAELKSMENLIAPEMASDIPAISLELPEEESEVSEVSSGLSESELELEPKTETGLEAISIDDLAAAIREEHRKEKTDADFEADLEILEAEYESEGSDV